jgi:hypothetical protein
MQVPLDRGLAVAAVGGDRAGHLAGAPGRPFDGGRQLRAVRDGSAFHRVVQDDARGAVHGIDRLWVADASVMPAIPAANTNLTTIVIAERITQGLQAHHQGF